MKQYISFLKLSLFTIILLLSHEAFADWRLQTEPSGVVPTTSTQSVIFSGQISVAEQGLEELVPGTGSSQETMMAMGFPSVDPDGDIIATLARQLEYDWQLIYQYVLDRIKTEPYTGLIRSPERTLLDGAGSPLEQAHLFSELIRSFAGSQVTGFGEILNWTVPVQSDTEIDICDLTGIPNYTNAFAVLNGGDMVLSAPNPLTPNSRVTLYRVLTGVMLSGNWYYFEPSFKKHSPFGEADFKADMGYSRSQLLSVAGGSGNDDWVSGLSVGGITNLLNTYSSNLLDSFQTNGVSVEEAWPVSQITEAPRSIYNGGTPPQSHPGSLQPAFNGKLIISGNAFSSLDLNAYDVAHKKISIRFESGGTYKAKVYVGEELKRTETTGGSFGADFAFSVSFIQAGITNAAVYNLKRGSQYVLCQSFGGGCNGDMSSYINKNIAGLKQQGYSDNSPEVFTESLRYTGQRWMDQITTVTDALALLTGMSQDMKYQFGIMAGETEGFHIDVKQQHKFGNVFSGQFALTDSFVGSAMEHAVLEQFQQGNAMGVSTLRIFNQANSDGMKIYRADSGNWNTIKNNLVGYDTTAIGTEIGQGSIFILPENNSVTIADWSGEGYVNYRPGQSISMKIGGDYDGGYNAWKNPYVPEIQQTYTTPVYIPPVMTYTPPASKDPVDMQSGAFLFDHNDLVLNGPLPLTLHRSYRSDVPEDSGMGRGWTHSLNIRAAEHSAVDQALGQRSGLDLVPFLAGMSVVQDLLDNESTAKDWAVASLVSDWTTQQLTQNAVSVYLGSKVLTFVKQPDGSYSPPTGMTVSLSRTNGVYVMQERHGNIYEFDANLNLSEIVDPHGNTLTFAYNTQTNLDTVTSSFGPMFNFSYTGDLLTSVADNDGRVVEYQYDSNNLTNFVDAATKNWGIAYTDPDHPHAITSLTDPEGIVTIQNTYNDFGQVVSQTSATGNPYTLYITGYQSTERDPLGHETTYYYDTKGRTVKFRNADGSSTQKMYDGWDHVVGTVNEAGVTNAFVFDLNHNLLSTTNAVGLPEQVVNAYKYDAEHHLRFTTNAVGTAEQIVTEYTYTPEHKVDTITEAKGTSLEILTDYNYNSDGLVEQISEGNNKRITTYNYDSNSQYGHPKTTTSTDAGTVTTIYDKQGNLKSQTVDGKTTTFSYDARRLQTGVQYEDTSFTTNTYWDNGFLKQTTDGRGKTTKVYWTDAYKQAGVVLPNTGSTTNLYDDADRLVRSRDAEGNWTTNTLNEVGQMVAFESIHASVTNQFDMVGNLTNSVIDPNGLSLWTDNAFDNIGRNTSVETSLSQVESQYDHLNRVTNSVNTADKDWKTEYDELGRVKKTFRPSGNYEEYGFDDLGNRTHFWNADSKPTTFGVDAQGRVTSITNAIGKVTSFDFDDAGNLSQRIASDLKVTDYRYDSLNRLVAITNQGVEVATFDHDNNGNTVLASDADSSVSFGYDEMNHLTASTQTIDSVTAVVGYGFDLNGNRTNIVYPGGLTVNYLFGADNRLEGVTTKYVGNTKTISFGYDTANRLDGIVYPNGINSTFGHDAEGRVTSIVHGTFVDRTIHRNALGFKYLETVDAGIKPTVPNTGRKIKTHNDADQLTSEWVQQGTNEYAVTYDYSENGCLETVSQASLPALSYGYDYDNRLQSVDGGATEYLYDASGARVSRIHNSVTNHFVIDYADGLKRPLAETDASGTVTRYYVWSGSQLLCHIEANGDVRYYHTDELGSTLALTKEDGAVTDEFAYMPYGYANHTPHAGSSDTPFQWLGGYGVYYDADTDLHLTLHRAYSSKLKRFIHPDPLGIDGGVNVYMWANMNPLAFVDPYGLEAGSAGGFFNSDIYGYASEWKTGLAEGAYNGAMGLGQLLSHPIQTIKGIPSGLQQGWQDTKQFWGDAWNGTGDPDATARTIGNWTFNAEAAVVTGAGARALKAKLSPTTTTTGGGNVSLYHQGNLQGGQVSAIKGLWTSQSSNLQHYRPGATLNKFQIPQQTYLQWIDNGLVQPGSDLYKGIVTPAQKIMPPASGQMNQYLVPPGG